MLTIEKKKKYTEDDYMMLEEGAPFQLINYNLVTSPSPLLLHQLILGELYDAFKTHLKATGDKGIVILPPIDVRLDEGNILQPDLVYIAADRIEELAKERIEGAPDLIVEILSPSNAYYDLRQKKNIYERLGVKEYIIVDPIEMNAEVYVLSDSGYQLHQKVKADGSLNSQVLPGLKIELSNLFK